jgi:hypothetical protein
MSEESLIRVYMELTGTSETCARAVFMFVCSHETIAAPCSTGTSTPEDPRPRFTRASAKALPGVTRDDGPPNLMSPRQALATGIAS